MTFTTFSRNILILLGLKNWFYSCMPVPANLNYNYNFYVCIIVFFNNFILFVSRNSFLFWFKISKIFKAMKKTIKISSNSLYFFRGSFIILPVLCYLLQSFPAYLFFANRIIMLYTKAFKDRLSVIVLPLTDKIFNTYANLTL